ncbi:MAG: adenylate/guanylate cyclase domain-containing protein [Chloroflexota bacterium]|nr:adenylate/guanylate cyclase domain-containing protein [Chloroflexota bacterium]
MWAWLGSLWQGRSRRQRRVLGHTGIVLAVGVAFTFIAFYVQPFASINWRLTDMLFLPHAPTQNVVIAAIDDQTLAEYGKWSEWPRSLHAQAIANLDAAGARVVGYDVLFADESIDDPGLAQAMADAGNVVLAVAGDVTVASPHPEVTFHEVLRPSETLEAAAVATGHANVANDGDGVVRRVPLVVRDAAGEAYPAFILAVLYTHFGRELPQGLDGEGGVIAILDRDVPVDGSVSMRIGFTGPPGTFTHISYRDIIEGTFDPDAVRHKMVLVGMTATGEPDSWVTPVSAEKMFGVEIHANGIDTILTQGFLVGESPGTTLLTLLLITLVAAVALPRLNLRWGGLLSAAMFVGYVLAVFFSFDGGSILNLLYPVIAVPLLYVSVVLCRVVSTQAERREVRDLFGRYVSDQVAGEIMKMSDSGALHLGGERRNVTVLFADARGFTKMSERMSPEEVVSWLNRYLSAMIGPILENEGMINKFAGDNIMAVWNAPQLQEDHAFLAVKAALGAQQAIEDMQEREPDLPRVQFGFGINSGDAVVGNMGSEGRLEYTVIGDSVNLASRICGVAPGTKVWIGPQTYEQVRDKVEAEPLEPQHFKGKEEAVVVYEVRRLLPEGPGATSP